MSEALLRAQAAFRFDRYVPGSFLRTRSGRTIGPVPDSKTHKPLFRFIQKEAVLEIEAALQAAEIFQDWSVLSKQLHIVRLEKWTPAQHGMVKRALFTKEDRLFGTAVVSVAVSP